MNVARILDRAAGTLKAKAAELSAAGRKRGATPGETEEIERASRMLSLALLFTAEAIAGAVKAESEGG